MNVAFLDLRRETEELRRELGAAFDAVLDESRFVGGGAVGRFEQAFASYCGAGEAVGVGSGTDAIAIALRAAGVGHGDQVITAANSPVPTVAGIALAGATPVLADVGPATLTLDAASAAGAVGPRTRALVPVHLYGRCAEMEPLLELARAHGLAVVEDAAQAHGAELGGRRVGMLGDAAAFSFYPTKNLGALGDAGAVVTSNPELAERARRLREYGWGDDRVSVDRAGQSRLDTLQAALLLAKLPLLERWNARRRTLAQRYTAALAGSALEPPSAAPSGAHVHHLYVVRSQARDALRERLRARGVETLVHYPRPVHEQPAWAGMARPGALAESERACREVLSLPLYPQLDDAEVDAVVEAVLGE
jgi:dTDP-4-amino-4,6-dideoxygalactose transaminase